MTQDQRPEHLQGIKPGDEVPIFDIGPLCVGVVRRVTPSGQMLVDLPTVQAFPDRALTYETRFMPHGSVSLCRGDYRRVAEAAPDNIEACRSRWLRRCERLAKQEARHQFWVDSGLSKLHHEARILAELTHEDQMEHFTAEPVHASRLVDLHDALQRVVRAWEAVGSPQQGTKADGQVADLVEDCDAARDIDALLDLLTLVGAELPVDPMPRLPVVLRSLDLEAQRGWRERWRTRLTHASCATILALEEWCGSLHLSASDHDDVEVPPFPAALLEDADDPTP